MAVGCVCTCWCRQGGIWLSFACATQVQKCGQTIWTSTKLIGTKSMVGELALQPAKWDWDAMLAFGFKRRGAFVQSMRMSNVGETREREHRGINQPRIQCRQSCRHGCNSAHPLLQLSMQQWLLLSLYCCPGVGRPSCSKGEAQGRKPSRLLIRACSRPQRRCHRFMQRAGGRCCRGSGRLVGADVQPSKQLFAAQQQRARQAANLQPLHQLLALCCCRLGCRLRRLQHEAHKEGGGVSPAGAGQAGHEDL